MGANVSPQDAVDRAFEQVPRAPFLPEEQRGRADADHPLPIGFDQTNSQPSTVAAMLRWLDVRPGHRVLDVGSGSGWTTALLAQLVGPGGSVLGLEVFPQLVDGGRAALAGLDLPWASIQEAEPGVLGAPGSAPFDRILVSAEAEELPDELVGQLADGGVMVAPVAGRMHHVVREGESVHVTRHGHFRFVPLRMP